MAIVDECLEIGTANKALAGNTVDGTATTSASSVDDLGGLLLNIGIGYDF